MITPSRFAVALLVLASVRTRAQSEKAPVGFEVASVRRNTSGELGARTQLQPGRFTANNATARQLILRAYGVQDFQIVGGPKWINADRFDISAKAVGSFTPQQVSTMLRTLLSDRFKLTVHRETRNLPIFALVVAKPNKGPGPKLHPSQVDCDAIAEAAAAAGGAPPSMPAGEFPPCSIGFRASGQLSARSKPMSQIVPVLAQLTQHVVVDRTGLKGNFDLDLTWEPEPAPGGPPPPDAFPSNVTGASIFTALQEQLGLKLESRKAPLEALVIDRIEAPSEN